MNHTPSSSSSASTSTAAARRSGSPVGGSTGAPGNLRGFGRRGVLISTVLVAMAIGAVAMAAHSAIPRRMRQPEPAPLTQRELEGILRANQISPEALTAAGLSAQQTTALIGRAHDALVSGIQNFRDAHQAHSSARRAHDRLERTVRAGLGGENAGADMSAAAALLAQSVGAENARLGAVRDAALGDELPGDVLPVLDAIQASKAWTVPIEYRARGGQISEAHWVALRDALANQRIRQAEGESTSQEHQLVLDEWHADPAVSAARTRLQGSLTEVKAAWDQALR